MQTTRTENKNDKLFFVKASLVFAVLLFCSLVVVSHAETDGIGNIFVDRDRDGLSDEEEKQLGTDPRVADSDGDSYSDGVEVRSGYDPLKPAPGDRITTSVDSSSPDSQNLTEKFSNDISTFVRDAEESGQTEIGVEEISAAVEKSLENTVTFENLPEVDVEELQIFRIDYNSLPKDEREDREREDAIAYFTALSYISILHSPIEVSSDLAVDQVMADLQREILEYSSGTTPVMMQEMIDGAKEALPQLQALPVPEEYLDLHVRGMRLTQYAISLENDFAQTNDPLGRIATLSKMQALLGLMFEYSNQINAVLDELGIEELPVEL